MRGYFGIGVEQISKPYNVGSLFRSAHAFGASFVFTVNASYTKAEGKRTDTSNAIEHLPFYSFPNIDNMFLPNNCKLVGVELIDDSIELPSFRHPINAAYILGPEKSSLSPKMLERCDYTIKIPTKFCLNVGIAGVLAMYDRTISMGKFAPRPVRTGGPTEEIKDHIHGKQIFRRINPYDYAENDAMYSFRDEPPMAEVELSIKDEDFRD